MKKLSLSLVLCLVFLFLHFPASADTPELGIRADAYLLADTETGTVICAENEHEALPPASVTKIMTMLLIMEAVDSGSITMDDRVTASEHAKAVGGSSIFLDAGEVMSVHDLLKGIAVASGNDASVAMAEYLAGSEDEFVRMMNERAAALGMQNTHFENCTGLDSEGHKTSAYDIFLMSRELLKHEKILDFTTIRTDNLRDGKFDLATTNKLIHYYEGATGLKTGSTDDARYCLSASATRDGLGLVAVILGAPSTDERFLGARKLLDYGFARYTILRLADTNEAVCDAAVQNGTKDRVMLSCDQAFSTLVEKSRKNDVEIRMDLPDFLDAPVKQGDIAGNVLFSLDGNILGSAALTACEDVPRRSFGQVFFLLLRKLCAE